ncbi:pyridoxal-phosphate dependent enzyme [Leifsonia sp. EB34]|uniref:pyridoxal-phosphate dependent enzyme n=1 Tax=Leifsonia sp. EB34 TaxID=3156303 RepID=UPI003518CC44
MGKFMASDNPVQLARPVRYSRLLLGATPVVTLTLALRGREVRLRLKLESFNPCGSIKDRAAESLFDSVKESLDTDVGFIESTSGNLGVALAAIAEAHRVPFTAVIDPRTPRPAIHAMRRFGARIHLVREPDGEGGYLLSRLQAVRAAVEADPRLVWTNQYENPANPLAHERSTGPELAEQIGRDGFVAVPVSTGGTLAGLRAYAARETSWSVVGVDVFGSRALRHESGRRILPGIGSSRASSFISAEDGPTRLVDSIAALSACLWLVERSGIGVGASSGALIVAALDMLAQGEADEVTCVCPDGASNYLDTVYSETWRAREGIDLVLPHAEVLRVDWEDER